MDIFVWFYDSPMSTSILPDFQVLVKEADDYSLNDATNLFG